MPIFKQGDQFQPELIEVIIYVLILFVLNERLILNASQ